MPIVLIWNNNMVLAQHEYPGHASLLIGNDWNNSDDYVSWFPASNDRGADNLRGGKGHNFSDDLTAEGYAPDHIIELPAGFDLGKMRSEWNRTKEKVGAHYRLYRKNCSTIASRVLKAGSNSGSFRLRHNAIWTPLSVKRLAFDMGGQSRSWEWLLTSMENGLFINDPERRMLTVLKTRDGRHGSSGNSSYYMKGKKVAQKVGMQSFSDDGVQRFNINSGNNKVNLCVWDGNIFYGGTLNQIDSQMAEWANR